MSGLHGFLLSADTIGVCLPGRTRLLLRGIAPSAVSRSWRSVQPRSTAPRPAARGRGPPAPGRLPLSVAPGVSADSHEMATESVSTRQQTPVLEPLRRGSPTSRSLPGASTVGTAHTRQRLTSTTWRERPRTSRRSNPSPPSKRRSRATSVSFAVRTATGSSRGRREPGSVTTPPRLRKSPGR